jgi:DNA-binding XRE family transcriptional regulator
MDPSLPRSPYQPRISEFLVDKPLVSGVTHPRSMDPRRVGLGFRAIRTSSRETQSAVARRAGVSQTLYSRAERGRIADLKVSTLQGIASALGAELVVELRFQGGIA